MTIKERLTNDILQSLEKGETPIWKKSRNSFQISGATGKTYNGFNQLLLQHMKVKKKLGTNRWLTFNQVKNLGGSVKKGEKAVPISYFKMLKKEALNRSTGSKEEKQIPLLKMYFVFNLDQTTLSPSQTMDIDFQKVKSAQEIIDNFLETDGPKVESGINPSYHPINDIVKMPPISDFYTEEEYFSTFFHELIHSTGHKSRLNRSGITEPTHFKSYEYSKEELIAESGACFLNSEAGIETPDLKENSKAYILGWLKTIKENPGVFISAVNQGWKAKEFIINSGYDSQKQNVPNNVAYTP